MKFLSALALASVAIASPLQERAAKRGGEVRRTSMKIPFNVTEGADEFAATEQSTNWAGAAITTTGVTEAVGTFTIPHPAIPSGGNTRTEYCGAAWVGIDGDSCQTGLIQSGVFWCIEGSATSFEAWFEWIPQASVPFSGITVAAGNQIKVTVTRNTNNRGGVTTLENVSTGVTVSHTFTNQAQGVLCGDNAEWIVEDFESGSSLVPFAGFGSVTFSGATAVANGATIQASTADNIVLVSSAGRAETSTTISGTTVTVNSLVG